MSRSLDILNKEYLDWMCELVCGERYSDASSYRKLLGYLYNRDFVYSIELDGNRAEDGVDLRHQFAYERGYNESVVGNYMSYKPCSVLEMMIALAIRCEEHIMGDPDVGDRTANWFWGMIYNLGLDSMDDDYYDEHRTEVIIDRFLHREYEEDGRGGLFTVKSCIHDLRNVEIWYQMCWYLDDILDE